MDLANRVKNLRKKLNLTQTELAELANTEQRSISRIELRKVTIPRNINQLAAALHTTPEYLQFGVGDLDNAVVLGAASNYLPLISMVQAGMWSDIELLDTSEATHYPCPVNCSEKSFIVRVSGESMFPDFKEGDLLYVDPEAQSDSGSFVIARLDDENQATFKQLIVDGGKKYLKATNPEWPNKFIEINGNCTIVGKVIFTGKEL